MILCLLVPVLLGTPAETALLDGPVYCESTDDLLAYDDGSARWLTWSGIYRGVKWDYADFWPAPC